MKKLFKMMLPKLPYFGNFYELLKKQGKYPAGHFYSPIPSNEEILVYLESRKKVNVELPDIKLNKESQFKLLQDFSLYYEDLFFPEEQIPDCRYYYDQSLFRYADAIFLYSFLRKNMPKRIVEVGSGFSSAVMLDTIERVIPQKIEITFIEPYPHRLLSILKDYDKDKVRLINEKVQDVPVDIFTSLGFGDLLFIDSSHVIKCGSDVQFLLFDVLPHLPSGVFVHFHDIFYLFEYPEEWLTDGRYWNEDYFVRAFLSNNSEWSIYFFNNYLALEFREFIEKNMPLCLKDPGGSLYIQKR